MSEPTLRIGLIGLGNVAVTHLEGYRQLSTAKVVAGADVRPDRTAMMAAKYGFAPYTDYRQLLERESLDIVAVLSSVNSHREIVKAAADRGLHVFCEKPIAVRLDDADAIISCCRDRGVKLFYGSSYRFLPPVVKAKELIEEGRIGEPRLLTESLIGGQGLGGYRQMGFEHYPAGDPGGSGNGLVDHGIHLADIFPWLISQPIATVFGRGQRSGDPAIAEYMVMEFPNGAVGHLVYDDATWSADLPSEGLFSWAPSWDELARSEKPIARSGALWQERPGSIRVYGTQGALRIYHYANQLFLRTEAGIEQVPVADRPMPGQFGAEMESFARSVLRGEEPEVTGDDGKRALRAVLGVYESMTLGRPVSL